MNKLVSWKTEDDLLDAQEKMARKRELAMLDQLRRERPSTAPQWFMLGLGFFLGVAAFWIWDVISKGFGL